jgi:hypothetical protein
MTNTDALADKLASDAGLDSRTWRGASTWVQSICCSCGYTRARTLESPPDSPDSTPDIMPPKPPTIRTESLAKSHNHRTSHGPVAATTRCPEASCLDAFFNLNPSQARHSRRPTPPRSVSISEGMRPGSEVG